MMTDYTPIDCGKHSEYELAIMQAKRLRVSWRDAAGENHLGVLTPIDLVTRDHAEYLIARDADADQQQLEIRLDYILQAEAL